MKKCFFPFYNNILFDIFFMPVAHVSSRTVRKKKRKGPIKTRATGCKELQKSQCQSRTAERKCFDAKSTCVIFKTYVSIGLKNVFSR